jgi:hypothetical protein
VQIRINALDSTTDRGSKFFVKMASVEEAGLVRLELNGRYIREHRVSLRVSFFASPELTQHLEMVRHSQGHVSDKLVSHIKDQQQTWVGELPANALES